MPASSIVITAAVTAALIPTAQARINVRNRASNAQVIYVGGSDVSSVNGFPINPGEAFWFNGSGLYVCTAAATADVRVLSIA